MIGRRDRHGIAKAVGSSLRAIFYRDAHRGNDALFEETQAQRGRLIPVATANPTWVGGERDLAEAVGRWKINAMTSLPEYHGYSPSARTGGQRWPGWRSTVCRWC